MRELDTTAQPTLTMTDITQTIPLRSSIVHARAPIPIEAHMVQDATQQAQNIAALASKSDPKTSKQCSKR